MRAKARKISLYLLFFVTLLAYFSAWWAVTKLQKKIDDMENSSSLKIGRAITFVPRKLKKMLH